MRPRSALRQNGQVSWLEAPARGAAPADQQAIGGRRDDGKVGLAGAERAGALLPAAKSRARHDRVAGARQERSHRPAARTSSSPAAAGLIGGALRLHGLVPRADDLRQRSASRGRALRRAGSRPPRLPRASASPSRCRAAAAAGRSNHRQVLELQDRPLREQRVQVLGLELDRRQADPCLHPSLELEQLDLQFGRGRQVRVLVLQAPQLGDLPRLRADGCLGFLHGADSSRAGDCDHREGSGRTGRRRGASDPTGRAKMGVSVTLISRRKVECQKTIPQESPVRSLSRLPPQKAPRTASARKRTPKAAQAKPEPVVAPRNSPRRKASRADPTRESRSESESAEEGRC